MEGESIFLMLALQVRTKEMLVQEDISAISHGVSCRVIHLERKSFPVQKYWFEQHIGVKLQSGRYKIKEGVPFSQMPSFCFCNGFGGEISMPESKILVFLISVKIKNNKVL